MPNIRTTISTSPRKVLDLTFYVGVIRYFRGREYLGTQSTKEPRLLKEDAKQDAAELIQLAGQSNN
ncbi:MAG: hypothetical protein H8D23_18820 [Candidatus Brocadiales bacterium]|nr:hypothetical protein [Candidatus Brocadiales bacterium]